ncbi:MAG: IS6 family transposase [Halioglobus sp.]
MNTYKRHRFPSDIISYAVWLYYRFNLSHRDIEDLLAERGITLSREAIRLWCIKFGALYARRLKRKHRGYGDTFYIDEVFVKINGKQHCLWRAVDQDGEVVDVYLQAKRDGAAATLEGTWSELNTIENSGSVRSMSGAGRLPEIV